MKSRNKTLLYFLLLFLFLINVLFGYIFSSNKKKQVELGKQMTELKKQMETSKMNLFMMKENVNVQIQNEGIPLQLSDFIIDNSDKSFFLNKIMQGEKIFVVCLPNLNCQPCINILMNLLKKKKISNVAFWVNCSDKDFIENLKAYQIGRFFLVKSLPISSKNIEASYMFVLDSDMSLKHLHIYDMNQIDLLGTYFDMVDFYMTSNHK